MSCCVLLAGCDAVSYGKEMYETVFGVSPSTVNGAKTEVLNIMNESFRLTVKDWKYETPSSFIPSDCVKNDGSSGVNFSYTLYADESQYSSDSAGALVDVWNNLGFVSAGGSSGSSANVEGVNSEDPNFKLSYVSDFNSVKIVGYSRCVDGSAVEHIRDSLNLQ